MKLLEEIKEIKKSIKHSKKVFLMAHKNLDLDAIGSCLGMYYVLTKLNKECYIVIDDTNHEMGVQKILYEIEGNYNIITSNKISETQCKRNKQNLLIILDTNRKDLLQNKEALDLFENVIVLDHHELGKSSVNKGIVLTDTETSSACELVVQLASTYEIEFNSYIATLLLAGITLDTNSFALNTNEETFYTAYYLSAIGASTKKVQYLLKQDINSYIEQQKLLTNIEVVNKVAIANGTPHAIHRREDLAKIADILLFFNDIEVSFVIGKISKDTIGVSARSLGNINIEPYMEKLGGGGNKQNGAVIFENKNISEVVQEIKKVLKKESK